MAPYARFEVTLITIAGVAVAAGVGWMAGWWAIVPAVVALALLAFYRDPRRVPPGGDDVLLAPADGKVVAIEPGAELADGRRVLRIMIFLSVFDVHINRVPCAGRITEVSYRPGRFLNALRTEADTQNESNTITLTPRAPLPGPICVRQVAGVLARRIVCTAQAGQNVAGGARFGMIKLGSRTELTAPADAGWTVMVRLGQHVAAGETIVARLGSPAAVGQAAEPLGGLRAHAAPGSRDDARGEADDAANV